MIGRIALTAAFAAPLLAAAFGPAFAEGADCRCRYHGKYFGQGETVCIRVGDRERLARCDMVLNNTSWTFLTNSCPSAQMMTPVPASLSAAGPAISPL